MKFETDYIEKLAKIISDNGLTEISLEDGEQAITIRKDLPEVNMVASAPAAVAATPAPQAAAKTLYLPLPAFPAPQAPRPQHGALRKPRRPDRTA